MMCEMPLDPPYVNEPITLRMIRDANRRARARHPEGKLPCDFCGEYFYRMFQHRDRQHMNPHPTREADLPDAPRPPAEGADTIMREALQVIAGGQSDMIAWCLRTGNHKGAGLLTASALAAHVAAAALRAALRDGASDE